MTQDNFTIPDWARSYYPETMSRVSIFSYRMLTMTKTLKRLRGGKFLKVKLYYLKKVCKIKKTNKKSFPSTGPLLREIITHMKEKETGTLRQKLWLYSAHDVTLTCLMDAMGIFEPHIPPLSATLMIELRKDKNRDYFVSVNYKLRMN